MANYTSTHTGATIDASVTIVSSSGVTQSDLTKLNAVTSSAIELNILDGVTASTAEINILDGLTATTAELNYLDGADSSITTLSLPDNTTITTFGASLIDDADAATARTTLGVDVAGTDNSTDVTLVTTSHDYLSISGQAITLGSIDISDDTNLVGGTGITLTGDTLSTTDSEIVHDNLSGFVANEHIDHSTVSISAGTGLSGGGDLTSTRTLSIDSSVVTLSGTQTLSNKSISGTANTISNVHIVDDTINTLTIARGGTGGTTSAEARSNLNVDVAGTDNSTDVTLVTTSHDYLSLSGQAITLGQIDISDDTNLVGGTGITLTGDTLSTTDSEIVHDDLSGFVANEHIDHSGVSITAGAGLTGGGDITTTRDIAVGAGTGVTVNADDIAIGQDVGTTQDVTFNSVTADIIGDIRGATKFQAKADVALNKGDAVYISGVSGTTPTVDIADANDSAKMPSFGLAASSVSINASVEIITFGTLAGLNTSAFSVGDIIYISTNGTSGNTLTATAPSGESSLIQNIGIVQRSHASAGSIKVGGAGRTNATPNLDDGDIFIGNGSNQAVTASLNTKIEDYLDGGTSTANFDTISVDGAEITATPAELNVLDGITSTTAELNYTDGVTSNIQTQLDAKAPLASPAFTGTATGANLTLSGDLTVNGSTTTLDTTNLAVEDNLMELNAGVTSNANDSGFLIERGSTGDNAIFMWDESADKFTLGTTTATGTTTGDITLSSTGTLVANVEGDVTGAVTGNADTATTLATARNFSLTGDVTAGAVSFDGSGNVALSTTIAANSVALGTDTTGNYMSDLTEGTGIDISHTPGEGSNGTITLDLTEVGFGGGANRLITDDGDGTVSTEANLTFDGSNLNLAGNLKLTTNATYLYSKDASGNSPRMFGINAANSTYIGAIDAYAGGNILYGVSSNVADQIFYTGGSERLRITSAGDLELQATKKLYLDGGSNTYITESSADILDVFVGGTRLMQFREESVDKVRLPDNIRLGIGNADDLQLYHDASHSYIRLNNGNCYFKDDAFNNILIVYREGGGIQLAEGDLKIPATSKLYLDGGVDTYIDEPSGDQLRLVAGGTEVLKGYSSGAIDMYGGSINRSINIGANRTADAASFIDLVGDTTYTDYGARLIRNSGANAITDLSHRGTGALRLRCQDAGAVLFMISDAEKMRVASSGNVGIGTSSPTYELDVEGDIGMNAVLYHNGDDNTYLKFDTDRVRMAAGGETLLDLYEDGTQDYVKLGDGGDVDINLNDDMFVRGSDGNVGIGTTSPDTRLDVTAAGANGMIINQDTNDATNSSRVFFKNSTGTFSMYKVGGYLRVNSGATAGASSGGTNLISIGSNVGIGTTSPSAKLVIDGGGDADADAGDASEYSLLINQDNNDKGIAFGLNGADDKIGAAIIAKGSGYNSNNKTDLQFYVKGTTGTTAPSNVMTLQAGGNVGIGTTSPSFKLKVNVDNGTYTDIETIAAFQSKRSADSDTEAGLFINAIGDALGGQISSNYYYTDNIAARGNTGRSGAIFGMSNNAGAAGTHSSFYWQTSPNNSNTLTDRMQLDTNGNLKLFDNTANPSASTNNAFIFCDSGEMKVLDELGNTTTISPHNFDLIPGGASEDRAWGYYSEKDIKDEEGNVTSTQKVNVDMMKLARLVEQLTGEKLVYTEEDE